MGAHLTAHGDGAKDVAFSVEDLDAIIGKELQGVWTLSGQSNFVFIITVKRIGWF